MKKISWISVTQVRLFRNDEIPLSLLQLPLIIQQSKVALGFTQDPIVQPAPSPDLPGSIVFVNGQFVTDSAVFAVPQLQIEPRRIRISISATSDIANLLFERLKQVMISVDTRSEKPTYDPLVLTEETGTAVNLDSTLRRLFLGDAGERLLAGLQATLESHGAVASIEPVGLRYHVRFSELPEALRKYGVTLLEKDIRIEVRNQTPAEDKNYFIVSPNSSDSHFALIDYLENTFGEK